MKYYRLCILFLLICPIDKLYSRENDTEFCVPVALKSNLLYDAVMIPNIGIEIGLQEGFAIEASYMGAWWKNDSRHYYWQCYGGDINVIKYFGRKNRSNPFSGHFLGLYFQLLTYDFELGKAGFQSKLTTNPGIEYGYSIPLGSRVNLAFCIGVGYFGGESKKYKPIDSHYVHQSTRNFSFLGPTKAEISISWLLNKHK